MSAKIESRTRAAEGRAVLFLSMGVVLVSAWLQASHASAQERVPGIDVSNYQESIDWPAVAGAGKRFAIVLATDGTNFTNQLFDGQYDGAKGAGLYAGAYHFARPSQSSGTQQADVFLDRARYAADGHTLPPALDLEWQPQANDCYGLAPAAMVSWVREFVSRVKERTGTDALIYTSSSFWNTCTNGDTSFGNNPLWVVDPNHSDNPLLPAGWGTWTIWQYAVGSSGGVQGDVDLDRANGGEDVLARLAGGTTNPPPPPPPPDGGSCESACNAYGCVCVDGTCAGGFCPGTGCSAIEEQNCAAYGTACVDHQCNGGYAPGHGCTALEEKNCAAYGTACVDHQCNGGFAPGHGCTALEEKNCAAYGTACVDHQCNGGYAPGHGCTALEETDCQEQGLSCIDHQCGTGCTAREQTDCDAQARGCAAHNCT